MIANLHIKASLRDGKTFLSKNYCTPPFRIADITENKKAGRLELMLMSSSPGVLDGDQYQLKVDIDENCWLQLHTQSYQRLFNMKTGATQAMDIRMAPNSSFICVPHPAVPHEHSIFTTRNNIYLADHCNLIWGEVLTCGRKLNGEIFQLSKYQSINSIFGNDRLVIKENLLIQPLLIDPFSVGQLEGFTHQASLVVLLANAANDKLKTMVYEYLCGENDISFGISAAPVNGIIVRILGHKGEKLFQLLRFLSALLSVEIQPSSKPIAYVI